MIQHKFVLVLMFCAVGTCFFRTRTLKISRTQSIRNFAQRKKYPESMPPPITKPGWVTVKFGSEEREKALEMDDRLDDAERWVSKKLTDEETKILNRAMGIEDEIMEQLGEVKSTIKRKTINKNFRSISERKVRSPTESEELKSAARVRGFLELNPYLCSGCGTSFQSKSPDSPGYLQKDKLRYHREQAEIIKEKQEAIKILEMAGLDINSSAAENILKEANISSDVIEGVKALGRAEEYEREMQMNENENLTNKKRFQLNTRKNNNDYEKKSEIYEDVLFQNLDINIDDQPERERNLSTSNFNSLFSSNSTSEAYDISHISQENGKSVQDDDIQTYLLNLDSQHIEINNMINKQYKYKNNNISNNIDTPDLTSPLSPIENKSSYKSSNAPQSSLSSQVPSSTTLPDTICICQRCYRLQQYGQVEETLRPGWSSHELLTPERFEQLLRVIKETDAVVLCIVDIFDLHGSLLPNLKAIAGSNPIVIAANKIDLLPKDTSQPRVQAWIHETVKSYCNLRSPRDAEYEHRNTLKERGWVRATEKQAGVLGRSNVHLVSCQSGVGMQSLMSSLVSLASENGNKVYVMGAANVGKSSFINKMLTTEKKSSSKKRSKTPQATVSNLPGTTLDFIKIRLPNGITVIDTPGLINKGQLTSRLTTSELRQIIPMKPINAITLRVVEGKCVLMGGIARIELTEGRPVFLTFYISNEVKLHPTDSEKAEEFLLKHAGQLISPPSSVERLKEIGPTESHSFTIEGDSWKKAANDIFIAGLGWIAVTGPGRFVLTLTVPHGTSVGVRESLMPYDAKHTTAKFTGGRLSKKSSRPGSKNYGWRA